MNTQEANYYAVIPANVRYDFDLPPLAKLLYGEIAAFANTDGYCTTDNQYFANLYGISVKQVVRLLEDLKAGEYISILDTENHRQIFLNGGLV